MAESNKDDYRKKLSDEEYNVLREAGTEPLGLETIWTKTIKGLTNARHVVRKYFQVIPNLMVIMVGQAFTMQSKVQ